MLDSVRIRLTLWYVGVLALVLLAFSVGVYALLARSLNERLDNGLRDSLEAMATSLTRELTEGLAEAEEMAKAEEMAEAEELTLAEVEVLVEKEAAFSTIEDLNSPHQAIAIFDARGRLLFERSAPGNLHAGFPSFGLSSDQSVRLYTLPGNREDERGDVRVALRRVQATTKGALFLIVVA
ncbi:MAG: hypothetical protein M3R15_07175, partial [Acidobacteriota bacterium]|nr:hypothetical protein [Acidobacteriota bacterium]